ncbi:MAG TPA: hypothetical protein VJA47_05220 [archaeon]|nr:hypothetical protein [archaeon]
MISYADFEERGYKVEAFMTGDERRPHWYLKVSRGDRPVTELCIRMTYVPRFGVDLDDKEILEQETTKLMQNLD